MLALLPLGALVLLAVLAPTAAAPVSLAVVAGCLLDSLA